MKKVVLILLLMVATTKAGFSAENLFCLDLGWQLDIRCGIEHKFNSHLGMKSDIGLAFPGILVADAFLVVYLLPDSYRWHVNICTGVPNASVPLGANAVMVSLGGSLLVRYRITERRSMNLRLGEGFPLFFEKDKDIIRNINLPLGLWPDITLGLAFKL